MKLLALTAVLLVSLAGVFSLPLGTPGAPAGSGPAACLFGGVGSPTHRGRCWRNVGIPLLSVYIMLVATELPGEFLTGDLVWLLLGAVVAACVWRAVWDAASLPADHLEPPLRPAAIEWYRRAGGWMLAGFTGLSLVQFLMTPPPEACAGLGLACGFLFAYWCYRYFTGIAFPTSDEAELLATDAREWTLAWMLPVRLAVGAQYVAIGVLAGTAIPLGGSGSGPWPWGLAVLALWLGWKRLGIAARTLAAALPGARLHEAERAVESLRQVAGGDRELSLEMPTDWSPEVRILIAREPAHGPWDLLVAGLVLASGALLPLLSVLPFVALGTVPAFWVVACAALAAASWTAADSGVRTATLWVLGGGLFLSHWLSPVVAPAVPVASCIGLLWLATRLASEQRPGMLVACGRPGRWWRAEIPADLGLRTSLAPGPEPSLAELGWTALRPADLVPWAPLWQASRAHGRRTVGRSALGLLLLGVLLWAGLGSVPEVIGGLQLLWARGLADPPMMAESVLDEMRGRLLWGERSAPGAVTSALTRAQRTHDLGPRDEFETALGRAIHGVRGWQLERLVRLERGVSRERRQAEKIGLWRASLRQGPDEAEAAGLLEQSNALACSTPELLGYSSPAALAARARFLVGQAIRRAPAQSEARVLWYVRTAELRTAPLWLTGQATHRRTLLELLAAKPVLSP